MIWWGQDGRHRGHHRRVNDRRFLDAVLAGDALAAVEDAAANQSACCPGAVAATLEATRACSRAIRPTLVSHTLSYGVQPASRFVGYAGLVL